MAKSKTTDQQKPDLVEVAQEKVRGNKFLAPFIIIALIVIGLGTFVVNLDNIITFCKKYFAGGPSQGVKTEQSAEMIKILRDNAMWSVEGDRPGDRRSYLTLLSWADNPKDIVTKSLIISAIEDIEDAYGQTDVLRQHIEPVRNPHRWWICKESIPSCQDGFEEPTGYKAQNIINHLARKVWQERGRAASILRNINTATDKDQINNEKKEQLFNKLIERLNPEKENSLFVAKMALETYKDLTGFLSDGVFDFSGAVKHWGERKDEILKINF